MIIRTQHTTDFWRETGKKTRRIKNWSNYQTTGGLWLETDLQIRQATAEDDFKGYPLDWIADGAPLNFFVGNSSAAGGRPWWGVRKSDDSGTGVVVFLEDGDASAGYTVDGPTKSIRWAEVLPDVALTVYARTHRIDKWLHFDGASDRATLGFILPDGWTLEVENSGTPGNRLLIKRPNGVTVFTSPRVQAFDANDDAVPCTLISKPNGTLGGFVTWRVVKRIDPTGAVRPIRADSSVTISGTTDIEDTYLSGAASQQGYNYGAFSFVLQGSNGTHSVSMYRLATSALPEGTITKFRHYLYVAGYTTEYGNVRYAAVKAANDWLEGTKAGATAGAGECSFDYCKHDTQVWAGSEGCQTIGTDLHSEGSYTEDDTRPDAVTAGVKYFDLTTSWVSNWKSGTWTNNGFAMIPLASSIASARGYTHRPTEYSTAAHRPYFEIDYNESAHHYYNMLNAMRRR